MIFVSAVVCRVSLRFSTLTTKTSAMESPMKKLRLQKKVSWSEDLEERHEFEDDGVNARVDRRW